MKSNAVFCSTAVFKESTCCPDIRDIMMHSVMKCWWALSILQLSHGLVHGDMPLDSGQPSHRRLEPSYISEIGQWLIFNM